MSDYFFSVIIPTYNNQDTILRALESVKNQTFKNFEIIVVNDASTDKTLEICEKFKEEYKSSVSMKIITNEVNKGVGISRKVGFDNCHCLFVTFLDSDDYFYENFLEFGRNFVLGQDPDVIHTAVNIKFPEKFKKEDVFCYRGDILLEGPATIAIFMDEQISFFTGAFYRKTLMDKVEFSPNRLGEDVPTLFKALYLAKKVRLTNYSGYCHFCREGSLFTAIDQIHSFCLCGMAFQDIIDFLLKHNDMEKAAFFLRKYVFIYNGAIKELKGEKPCPIEDYVTMLDVYKYYDIWKKYVGWFFEHINLIQQMGMSLERLVIDESIIPQEIERLTKIQEAKKRNNNGNKRNPFTHFNFKKK